MVLPSQKKGPMDLDKYKNLHFQHVIELQFKNQCKNPMPWNPWFMRFTQFDCIIPRTKGSVENPEGESSPNRSTPPVLWLNPGPIKLTKGLRWGNSGPTAGYYGKPFSPLKLPWMGLDPPTLCWKFQGGCFAFQKSTVQILHLNSFLKGCTQHD